MFMNLPALAIEQGDGFSYLSPIEKAALEKSIEEMGPSSFCGRTQDYFDHRKNGVQAVEKADLVLVDKKRRILHLLKKHEILASYRIAIGANPVGNKEREGDGKTPEGLYFFEIKNQKSQYYLSLGINYPNAQDKKRTQEKGIHDPGKEIMVHGLPNNWFKRKLVSHPRDWTRGCMAVTNNEIEEIFAAVDLGTLIEICP